MLGFTCRFDLGRGLVLVRDVIRNFAMKWVRRADSRMGLGLGLLLIIGILPLEAQVASNPPSAADLDLPYSADNPPGPTFTVAEKERQFTAGAQILAGIKAAFQAGQDSYVIPAGDYRFDAVYQAMGGRSFALQGMHGNPAKPFRIVAYGATFWFGISDIPAPHYHQMIKVVDCSHLSLEGFTVDSDPRGSMDARITAFDFVGNRIQVRPVAGTRLMQRMPAGEGRFIPFKANGRHIAALYQIDEGWGPGNFFYDKMEQTADGFYWFTLKNRKLLETIQRGTWQTAYGTAGTLEVGDMLGFVYSTSAAISLLRCQQITVRDARFFAAKAGLDETDGYGDHHWINCHFIARPGTNQLLGGDGVMSACRHGSTFDHWVLQRTTDDAFNNHGHWKHVVSVVEHRMTFKENLPTELAAGHLAEAYDVKTDQYLGRLTVEAVEGKTVVFREPLGNQFATSAVIFTAFQNAGWVIRNSIFTDSYQRVCLNCGPGLFEGNRLERVGAGLTLGNGRPIDIEGGDPHGVVIRDNVFVDTALAPTLQAIRVRGNGAPIRNLEISHNLFIGTGAGAVRVESSEGAVVRDNIAIRPMMGAEVLSKTSGRKASELAAFKLKHAQGGEVAGNLAAPSGVEVVRVEASQGVKTERNRTSQLTAEAWEAELRPMLERHTTSAAEILQAVQRRVSAEPTK